MVIQKFVSPEVHGENMKNQNAAAAKIGRTIDLLWQENGKEKTDGKG